MRTWQVLFFASALLLFISGGLHFFAPQMKEKVLSKGIKKVTYKKLAPLNEREEKIRERIREANAQSKVESNQSETIARLLREISSIEKELTNECDKVGSALENYPDLIDSRSRLYQDDKKVGRVLNDALAGGGHSIRKFTSSLNRVKDHFLGLDPKMASREGFENFARRFENVISFCGLNNVIGPIVLTMTEVSSGINPTYKPLLVRGVTNLAMAYFSINSFSSLFLGAGLLRNMNSQNILNKNDAYDLQVLSERLKKTHANFEGEWRKAKTLQDKKDIFRYYNEETLVLAELLKELTQKIQASY